MPTIGILALQGDYEKHAVMLKALGAKTLYIREATELDRVDGFVIPGGESTTIGKLLNAYSLLDPLRERILCGAPVFGTCAGLILLAMQTAEKHQHRLSVLDILVERNAYGRQVDSFEADITIPMLGEPPVPGVFIRAPVVQSIGEGVEVLARFEDKPVLLKQGNILAGSFHPELTNDTRIHNYFLELVG